MFRFFADDLLFEQMSSGLVFWFHFAVNAILKLFWFIFEVLLIPLKFVIEDDVVFEIILVIKEQWMFDDI